MRSGPQIVYAGDFITAPPGVWSANARVQIQIGGAAGTGALDFDAREPDQSPAHFCLNFTGHVDGQALAGQGVVRGTRLDGRTCSVSATFKGDELNGAWWDGEAGGIFTATRTAALAPLSGTAGTKTIARTVVAASLATLGIIGILLGLGLFGVFSDFQAAFVDGSILSASIAGSWEVVLFALAVLIASAALIAYSFSKLRPRRAALLITACALAVIVGVIVERFTASGRLSSSWSDVNAQPAAGLYVLAAGAAVLMRAAGIVARTGPLRWPRKPMRLIIGIVGLLAMGTGLWQGLRATPVAANLPSSAGSTAASPTTVPDASSTPGAATGTHSCMNAIEGFSLTLPQGWSDYSPAGAGACHYLDTQPPSPGASVLATAIAISTSGSSYSDTVSSYESSHVNNVISQRDTTVGGAQAVVLEIPGDQQDIPGATTYLYIVDHGTALVISADSAYSSGDVTTTQAAVDAIAASLKFTSS